LEKLSKNNQKFSLSLNVDNNDRKLGDINNNVDQAQVVKEENKAINNETESISNNNQNQILNKNPENEINENENIRKI
jgi:hypothetical protein